MISIISERLYICRDHWKYGNICYQSMYNVMLPVNHTSGYWDHGFDFSNDYFLLLGIL